MSTEKGSAKKSGPPKHQNRTTFRNDLHDTSKRTKQINSLEVVGACLRCKEVIEWKIKYKKYKPLTVPKKCVRCGEKNVKKAYFIACDNCAEKFDICAKCNKKEEVIQKPGLTKEEEARQRSLMEQEIKMLPERKRRTFLRLQESGKLGEGADEEGPGADDSLSEEESDGDKDLDSMDQGEAT